MIQNDEMIERRIKAAKGIVKLRDISKAGTWAHDQTQAIWCFFTPPFPT
jgi:hypothetical protein